MKGISSLIDSDMEDVDNTIDENSILSSASDANNADPEHRKPAQARKPRKRKPVTMPKPKSRVAKPRADAPIKKPNKAAAGAKRKALEEQVNGCASATDPALGSEDELESPKTIYHKPELPSKAKHKKPQRFAEESEDMEVDQNPAVARSSHAQSKPTTAAPKVAKKAAGPKTKQVKPITTGITEPQLEGDREARENSHDIHDTIARPRQNSTTRTASRRPQDILYRRRAGSASDTERSDPTLRRKLGDITLKFENIDLKYRTLKEVGIHEATANVEKMRRQYESASQKSAELITSLRAELAMKAPLAQDAHKKLKDLQVKDVELSKLKDTVSSLTKSLSDAQNEIKTLQAKLSASRSTPVETTNTKTPGSTSGNSVLQRTVVTGSAEAVQAAQMKEDLYSDLTGLIIRSVKKTPEGDAYDCIQTGRNGTLHFKLYVDQEDAKKMSFEETEFLYTPLLDTNRDREMIDLMPDYLRDEITFARQNAAKFYSRVVDTLTKRRADE